MTIHSSTSAPLSYIENGVLKAPFCDKKTAQKFGFTPSGSAYAAYDGAPETGPSCAAIKPGASFGTPAQLAFLLKDGKLAGKLPELQLSSSVYEMYGPGFLGVSSDTIMPLSTHHWLGFMMDVRKA